MSNETWLEAADGTLVNLSHLAGIRSRVRTDFDGGGVDVRGYYAIDCPPVIIAYLTSLEKAKSFLRIVSNLIKKNVRHIDAKLIADQVNNDNHEQRIG